MNGCYCRAVCMRKVRQWPYRRENRSVWYCENLSLLNFFLGKKSLPKPNDPIPRPPLLSNIKRSTPNVNGSCRMYKVFKRDILLIASSSEQNKEAAPLLIELAKVLEANSNKSKADCTPLTSYFILRKRYNFVGQQSALLFNYLFSKGVDALISYFKIRPQLFKRWIALSTV